MNGQQPLRRVFRYGIKGLAIAALQACAVNPLVTWDEPAKQAGSQARVLDQGKAFSAAARRGYQQKMNAQVGANTQLSSGLIGLGGVVAALAAGKAHHDAILGATLIGATGYALGNWNFDKRRLLIYDGAIAALDCADRAVTPLDMSDKDLSNLNAAIDNLVKAIIATTSAKAATERELASWQAANPLAPVAPFNAAIAATQQAITAAMTAQAAGEDLQYQAGQASARLIDAVRKIDQAANAALLETVGDLNRVPLVIAGLAGIAGSIAPGSGVEAALTDSLRDSVVRRSAGAQQADTGGAPPQALLNASADMARAVQLLHAAASGVLGKVKPLGASASANALADCGIGPINFAMSASPAKVSAPVGVPATYSVIITGGKPPYSVKLNGAGIPGVTVSGPDRLGTMFEVKVTEAATKVQSSNFMILDSSDPNRSLSYTVETAGAGTPAVDKAADDAEKADAKKAADAKAATARLLKAQEEEKKKKEAAARNAGTTTPGTGMTLDQALAAIQPIASFEMPDKTVVEQKGKSTKMADTIEMTVACKPQSVAPACLKPDDVRAALLAKIGAAATDARLKLKFSNAPGSPCLCK